MRRAESLRLRELVVGQVDRDDLAGAGGLRAEQRREAHPAETDDGRGRAGTDLRGVDDGADARHDRATEQRRLVERYRLVDFDQRAAGHRRVLREHRASEVMVQGRTVDVQALRTRQQRPRTVRGGARLAQRGPTVGTRGAVAAARHEDDDDVVADSQVVDVGAERFDDAGRLVSEGHRQGPRPVPVDHRKVGVTETRGRDLQQDLARPRWIELHFHDRQRLRLRVGPFDARTFQYRGLDQHRLFLSMDPVFLRCPPSPASQAAVEVARPRQGHAALILPRACEFTGGRLRRCARRSAQRIVEREFGRRRWCGVARFTAGPPMPSTRRGSHASRLARRCLQPVEGRPAIWLASAKNLRASATS